MQNILNEDIRETANSVLSFIWGIISAILGYFMPVSNIVHQLIFFFIIDILFGYLAARKLHSEKFSAKIIWKTTIPRMLISIAIILLAFIWDQVYAQTIVCTYKIIGWFISGVLLFSICQNAYKITDWDLFMQIGKILKQKVFDKTGVNIPKKGKE